MNAFEEKKQDTYVDNIHYTPYGNYIIAKKFIGIVNSLEAYDSSYDISAAGVGNGGRRGSCGPESSASAGLEKYGQAVEAR